MPGDVQRELRVPPHIAEELGEALVGGLWTAPRVKKKVWQGLVRNVGAFPCTAWAAGQGRGWGWDFIISFCMEQGKLKASCVDSKFTLVFLFSGFH